MIQLKKSYPKVCLLFFWTIRIISAEPPGPSATNYSDIYFHQGINSSIYSPKNGGNLTVLSVITENGSVIAGANITKPTALFNREKIDRANYLLWICFPILLACCTIGNILNLIVLIKEKNKGSTNSYMIAVAVSDLFVLWLYVPTYSWNLSSTFKLPYKNSFHRVQIDRFRGIQDIGTEAFINLCDWVLLAFSLERLSAITRPFSFRFLQEARTARLIIVILFFVAIIFSLFVAVNDFYIDAYHLQKSLDKRPSWLLQWNAIQEPAEVSNVLFKFFALLVINILVIIAIERQRRSDIGKQRALRDGNSNSRYRNSNILLLSSVMLYLTAQFPSLVYNCLILADMYGYYNFSPGAQFFATPFCNVSLLTNYSVNFFLYLTTSSRYRMQFVATFGPYFCPGFMKSVVNTDIWRSIMRSIRKDVSPPRHTTGGGGTYSTRGTSATRSSFHDVDLSTTGALKEIDNSCSSSTRTQSSLDRKLSTATDFDEIEDDNVREQLRKASNFTKTDLEMKPISDPDASNSKWKSLVQKSKITFF